MASFCPFLVLHSPLKHCLAPTKAVIMICYIHFSLKRIFQVPSAVPSIFSHTPIKTIPFEHGHFSSGGVKLILYINYKTIESFVLEGTSNSHLVQLPRNERGYL